MPCLFSLFYSEFNTASPMSNKPGLYLQRLLRMGILTDMSFVDAQKTYMVNLFLLVSFPFAALSLVINLIQGSPIPALMNVFQILLLGTGFYISYKGKGMHLRSYLLLLLFCIAVFAAIKYNNGGEYRIQIMMFAAVVLFDRNWQYLIFSLLAICVFVLIKMADMPLAMLKTNELVENILKIMVPFCILSFSLYYYKKIYFTNLSALEISNRQLILAKEEKDKILNTVVHDLRSPVSNISGLCNLMLTDNQFTPEQKQMLLLVLKASDNSLSLINELLNTNVGGMHAGDMKKTGLNTLIAQSVSLLRVAADEKHITIHTAYAKGELYVSMDKQKIERVINNLVNNAVKFSAAGSEIFIETIREDKQVLILIRDKGIGIPPENQKALFDAGTRREGTAGETSYGLGLAICKQIIEEHKGSIAVESEVGKGTCFFVRLPFEG